MIIKKTNEAFLIIFFINFNLINKYNSMKNKYLQISFITFVICVAIIQNDH